MEFNNRLYELRKQKGLSQEELAGRINVSRQTISKWEIGDSTPDLEKLIALSDLFEVSLDKMVKGEKLRTEAKAEVFESSAKSQELMKVLDERVLTQCNKKRIKKGLKIVGIILGIFLSIDVISMILYFSLYGAPG